MAKDLEPEELSVPPFLKAEVDMDTFNWFEDYGISNGYPTTDAVVREALEQFQIRLENA